MMSLRIMAAIGACIVGAHAQTDQCQAAVNRASLVCCGGMTACGMAAFQNPSLTSMANKKGWCHQAPCMNALQQADTACGTVQGNAAAQAYKAMRLVITCLPDDGCNAALAIAITQKPCGIANPAQIATNGQAICANLACKKVLTGATTGRCSGSTQVALQLQAIKSVLASCDATSNRCSAAAMMSVGAACCPNQKPNGQQSLTCDNPSCGACVKAARAAMAKCPLQFMAGAYTKMLGNCGAYVANQLPSGAGSPCPPPALKKFRQACCGSDTFPCKPSADTCQICGVAAEPLTAVCATSFLADSNNQAVLQACSSQINRNEAEKRCSGTAKVKDACCPGGWPCGGSSLKCGDPQKPGSCTNQLGLLLLNCQTAQRDQKLVSAAQTCLGATCGLSKAKETCCPGGKWPCSSPKCGSPTSQTSCVAQLLRVGATCSSSAGQQAVQADRINIQAALANCAYKASGGGGQQPQCNSKALTDAKNSCCPAGTPWSWDSIGRQCKDHLQCGDAATGCAAQLTTALRTALPCMASDSFFQVALTTCGQKYASASNSAPAILSSCSPKQRQAIDGAKAACCDSGWPNKGSCQNLNCNGDCLSRMTRALAPVSGCPAAGLDPAVRNATLICSQSAANADGSAQLPRSLTSACCPGSKFPCQGIDRRCSACGQATCKLLASRNGVFMMANQDLQAMSGYCGGDMLSACSASASNAVQQRCKTRAAVKSVTTAKQVCCPGAGGRGKGGKFPCASPSTVNGCRACVAAITAAAPCTAASTDATTFASLSTSCAAVIQAGTSAGSSSSSSRRRSSSSASAARPKMQSSPPPSKDGGGLPGWVLGVGVVLLLGGGGFMFHTEQKKKRSIGFANASVYAGQANATASFESPP